MEDIPPYLGTSCLSKGWFLDLPPGKRTFNYIPIPALCGTLVHASSRLTIIPPQAPPQEPAPPRQAAAIALPFGSLLPERQLGCPLHSRYRLPRCFPTGVDCQSSLMLGNKTRITEIILLGFGDLADFQILFFLTFLVIYIVAITGNILILVLVIFDRHLHTPMYIFLGNISFLEVCYTSNIFPRMLLNLLTGKRAISFSGCFTQWYLCAVLIVSESCLFCAMSYDRYLAVCKPLHYAVMMKTQNCVQLAAASWISGFTIFLVLLILMLQLNYCGPNEIDHYFCDFMPILNLSCSDTKMIKQLNYVVAAAFVLSPFLLTLTSYVYIIAAILKISSITGRQKAFSTCSSHLIVVCIFYGSIIAVYMLPKAEGKRNTTKFPSLLYIVLPPLVNPFIYSLRNKEVKEALRNIIGRILHYKLIS
ncbi:olfactory receptor 2AP1-like [Sphaerodactylus townsendi]|uniref:olfactory receptor 2AP1-like n=1 Tax=Sphaerodactylus townsendi TaxID=933632 RepID=UPI002026C2B4|nr:olfactory receptor 2AP1-like [Sphaerodactylus townsendi]